MEIAELAESGNYVSCKCAGSFDTDQFIEVLNEAMRYSIQKNKKNLLVNVMDVESGPLDSFERYNIGKKVAAAQRSQEERVTIALVGNEPLIDVGRFGETVALNRGAVGKVFHDLQEAVAWIENMEGKKA